MVNPGRGHIPGTIHLTASQHRYTPIGLTGGLDDEVFESVCGLFALLSVGALKCAPTADMVEDEPAGG
jgi:hypothetical protein